jgi:hypothetical protein
MVSEIVDKYAFKVEQWIEDIEREQGPREAFRCLMDLMEYSIPKLARTEITGEGGGPVQIVATPLDEKL